MSEIRWDAFISHASEDKADVAIPLSRLLMASGLKVWLDEGEIFIGDSLREPLKILFCDFAISWNASEVALLPVRYSLFGFSFQSK